MIDYDRTNINGMTPIGRVPAPVMAPPAPPAPAHVHELSCSCGLKLLSPAHEEAERTTDALLKLSPKQQETVALAAHGYTYKEIGARMGISIQTVKNHLLAIRQRLGVETTMEAMMLVYGRRA